MNDTQKLEGARELAKHIKNNLNSFIGKEWSISVLQLNNDFWSVTIDAGGESREFVGITYPEAIMGAVALWEGFNEMPARIVPKRELPQPVSMDKEEEKPAPKTWEKIKEAVKKGDEDTHVEKPKAGLPPIQDKHLCAFCGTLVPPADAEKTIAKYGVALHDKHIKSYQASIGEA